LAPFENFRWQIVLFGEIFENSCVSGPGPGLGFAAAGEFQFVEQDFAKLLRRAQVELLVRERVCLRFVLQHALRKIAGEPRQHLRIDLDAFALHRREDRGKRALKRFVDGDEAVARQFGFELTVQAQCGVSVLA
jgi:hypothetical protein